MTSAHLASGRQRLTSREPRPHLWDRLRHQRHCGAEVHLGSVAQECEQQRQQQGQQRQVRTTSQHARRVHMAVVPWHEGHTRAWEAEAPSSVSPVHVLVVLMDLIVWQWRVSH
eukprot:363695-Chlamydomonas_euryale.AAC.1